MAPFCPEITDPLDTRNFSEESQKIKIEDTPVEHTIDKKLQDYFKDFTYRHEGIVFEQDGEESFDEKDK